MTESLSERAADHHAIVAVSLSYAAGIDHRNWERYRAVFTDSVEIDFSSWSGRTKSTMGADAWVDAVRSVNGNFDATQHLMTNHDVHFGGPDEAIGVNEVQAQHWFSTASMQAFDRPAAATWCMLGGHYTNHYVRTDGRWRMASCHLTVRWRTGDESIFALARQRSQG